jgi:hypothetical protein
MTLSLAVGVAASGNLARRMGELQMKREHRLGYFALTLAVFLTIVSSPGFGDGFNIEFVGHYWGLCSKVKVVGDYAYVAEEGKLTVLNVSNPSDPVPVAEVPPAVRDMRIQGDFAYLVNETDFRIIDISDPVHPAPRGSVGDEGSGFCIDIGGNIAYIMGKDKDIRFVDVEDPDEPTALTPFSQQYYRFFTDAQVVGQTLYLVGDEGQGTDLEILDVSDLGAPRVIGAYSDFDRGDVIAIDYPLCYAIRKACAVEIFDVTNPASIQLKQKVTFVYESTSDQLGVNNLLVRDNLLYVAGKMYGLFIFDVNTLPAPGLVAHYKTPICAADVDVANGLIYVCDMDGGLFILRYTGNDTTDVGGADINKDGVVDEKDQILLMDNWHREKAE